jgi:hypothetical protein
MAVDVCLVERLLREATADALRQHNRKRYNAASIVNVS